MPANKQETAESTRTQFPGMAGTGLPTAVGSAAVQAWKDMGTEAVRFVWDRLQQDLKTQQAMLACNNLEEMRKIQAEFFTSAQEQYTVEAAKMLDLMAKASPMGLATTAKARRYDDVPL